MRLTEDINTNGHHYMMADKQAEGPFEPMVLLPGGRLGDLQRDILEAEAPGGDGPPGESK